MLAELAYLAQGVEQHRALLDQIRMVRRLTEELPEPRDRQQLDAACQAAVCAIGADSSQTG